MANAKLNKLKIPKALGAAGELYISTRDARLALQKQVDALEEHEKLLKQHIIDTTPKSSATGVVTKLGTLKVVTKVVPQVADWDKFYEYVAKNKKKGGFALLNRAVNAGAVKEIWDAGKEVPGVKSFTAVTLSISKN
jgi:hypothetical protein